MEHVWYVAYGSNLCRERFGCYLAGGTPVGGMRRYDGCRDAREPLEDVSLDAPGALVFAGRSTVWGGGMAFYDGGTDGQVACRGYLVAVEQFARKTQRAYRIVGGVAARRIRQQGVLGRRDCIEQARLVRVLADVGAADRDGHDVRAACLHCGFRFGEILVLAGADQQPRGIRLAAHHQRIEIFMRFHGSGIQFGWKV